MKRWKPNAAQKAAFAKKMQDPEYVAQRQARKEQQDEKRRAGSQFQYDTAGGRYIPTKAQHDFAIANMDLADRLGPAFASAFQAVANGYATQTPVHHDQIHRVNEIIRSWK